MIIFLTSSPTGALDGSDGVQGLDYRNGFVDQLKYYWKENSRCCMIAAYPDHFYENDIMIDYFRDVFLNAGFSLSTFDLFDDRYPFDQKKLNSYDVILLSGGHVPTQNDYFQKIQLKEKIKDFQGIVIGISAGSMNSADVVYCQPEEDGESLDPKFKRWISGLALTNINIIPHYQMVKDRYLDGKRLYEDITYFDSYDHEFFVLNDGSYVFIDVKTVIYGKCHFIKDGKIKLLCDDNETYEIK